jgi:hypothetical protein
MHMLTTQMNALDGNMRVITVMDATPSLEITGLQTLIGCKPQGSCRLLVLHMFLPINLQAQTDGVA